MTNATLGLVGVICLIWSLLVAVVLHLMRVKLFDEPGLFWFSAVLTPAFLVGLFYWTHRIRYLWYVVMLFWLVQLLQGNKAFVLFVAVGYPTAILYEIVSRRFSSAAATNGEEPRPDRSQEKKTVDPPEQGAR